MSVDAANAECRSIVRGNISMEMGKIEQVIVGGEKNSAEIKSQPVVVPMNSHQHESMQCLQCFITFSNIKAKERHMRKDHPQQYTRHLQKINTLFTCYKCNKSFITPEELNQHQATHYAEKNPFICIDCTKRFCGFAELNKHRRFECIERRFACRDCSALFPNVSRLRTHRIAVHPQYTVPPEDIKTFQCCKCSCGFKTEGELLQHQEKFANYQNCGNKPQGKKRGRKPKCGAQEREVDGKKIKQEEEEEGYNEETSLELEIPCPKPNCDCVFPTVAALRAHKKEKHSSPSLKVPSTENTCLESFEKEHALKTHETSHSEGEEVTDKR